MRKYDVLLFDADNTLFDFEKAEKISLINMLEKCNLPVNNEIIEKYIEINAALWKALERGETDKETLKYERFERFRRYFGFSATAVTMAELYMDSLSQCRFMIDGAEDVCRELSKVCKLYIITNGIKHIQSSRFHTSAIEPYIERCFISEDIGYEKPDMRYFEYVEKSIKGFDKRRTLIIGDSLTSDIAGGKAFDIDTCLFCPDHSIACEGAPSTYIIDSLYSLENIVFGE